jgi:hypothetical protein
VTYPGAVLDPDTGQLISDAEVAETEFTAFGSTEHPVTARLIVRRVRDQNKLAELFPVWRHHPFFTNSTESTVQADLTHRRHAIIETVFADLIDGPLAHLPSNRFAANGASAICAIITHNLLRATGTLSSDRLAVARGATLRRQIINVPARLARPQRRPVLHLPAHWPWARWWLAIWTGVFHHAQPPPQSTRPVHRPTGTTGEPMWKRWADQRHTHASYGQDQTLTRSHRPTRPVHGSRLRSRVLPLLRCDSRVSDSRGIPVSGVVVLDEEASIYCGGDSVALGVVTILAGGLSVGQRLAVFVVLVQPRLQVGCHVAFARVPVTIVCLLVAHVRVGTSASARMSRESSRRSALLASRASIWASRASNACSRSSLWRSRSRWSRLSSTSPSLVPAPVGLLLIGFTPANGGFSNVPGPSVRTQASGAQTM